MANFRLMDSERNRSVVVEIIGTLNPLIVLLLLVNIKLNMVKEKHFPFLVLVLLFLEGSLCILFLNERCKLDGK